MTSPAWWRPTASNMSCTVRSRCAKSAGTSAPSGALPGRIEPPYMNTAGTLSRTIAIIMPGRLLSQPASPTMAS